MDEPTQPSIPPQHPIYQIRLKGHLNSTWSEWFNGMCIANEPAGECVISGPIVDQAALHGLLIKIRDVGLTLVEVKQVFPTQQVASPDRQEKL